MGKSTSLGAFLVMIYAKVSDASDLERLNSALSEAKKPQWHRRLMIIKLSATERMSVPKLVQPLQPFRWQRSELYS